MSMRVHTQIQGAVTGSSLRRVLSPVPELKSEDKLSFRVGRTSRLVLRRAKIIAPVWEEVLRNPTTYRNSHQCQRSLDLGNREMMQAPGSRQSGGAQERVKHSLQILSSPLPVIGRRADLVRQVKTTTAMLLGASAVATRGECHAWNFLLHSGQWCLIFQ
jgi:hypothetical protein